MHKKNFIKSLFGAIAVLLGIASCESYLDADRYFHDRTTIDSVFLRAELIHDYINGAAAYLPREERLFTDSPFPFGFAADECFASWLDARHSAMYFLLGEETPQTARFNNWTNFYRGIRNASMALARMGECKEMDDIMRRDLTGRAHFLRGFFYFSLLRQYGPVPIVPDTPYPVDVSIAEASNERNTYDECVDYIVREMEMAVMLLPESRETSNEFIPTKGAALGVISRVLLYAASPWYNGNTRYADWKTSDGRQFISLTPDPDKWGKAAAAAKRLIDLGRYEIFTMPREEGQTIPLPSTVSNANFPNGAGDIDPYLSYKSLFDGAQQSSTNPELILYVDCGNYGGLNRSPQWIATPSNLGGGNGMNVDLNFIDSYRMIDGFDINHSSQKYPYPQADVAFEPVGTRYRISATYDVLSTTALVDHMREARFYATIGYNHCLWPGTSYVGVDGETPKNVDVNYYSNGTAAPSPQYPVDYNRTGYTMRKYLHQEDHCRYDRAFRPKTFAYIRYAEILLNYVEAMNEMTGSYTSETDITVSRDISEMRKYFNMVRYRGGMPGVTDDVLNDVDKMRQAVRLERKIELAFEGLRYHDIRRWGIAYEVINEPVVGYDIRARSNERQQFYTRRILDGETVVRRVFLQRDYFYPIPRTVLDKNAKLVQNPGWD